MGGTVQATGIVRLDMKVIGVNEAKNIIFGLNGALDKTSLSGKKVETAFDNLRNKTTGLKRDISAFRNDILLMVFSLAGVAREFQKSIDASVKFQVALAGVKSVALATGNDISEVKDAALGLTKDGLLSLSGAAQGLKNLLSTGLNLKQATDLMRVFKDAAAFNRQGILEYEEAIVRATAGVKMQNIRLIDDVGIRTRIAQMMKKQGYELEDLTDETKKAGAVQALYSGLVNEGRYFLGDAAKLTQTFAGTQAQLEAQLLKTRAAFGDVITGTTGTGSAFASLYKRVGELLTWLELIIVANKDIISVKLDTYINRVMSVLDGLWTILKPILGIFGMIADVFSNTFITNFIIWGLVLSKLTLKIADFSSAILRLGQGGSILKSLQQTFQAASMGKMMSPYALTMERTKELGASESRSGLKALDNMIKAAHDKGRVFATTMKTSIGNLKLPLDEFRRQFASTMTYMEQGFKGLTKGNLSQFKKEFYSIGEAYGISRAKMNQIYGETFKEMTKLRNITNLTAHSSINFKGAWKGMVDNIKNATSVIMGNVGAFIKANAVMLGFQAAIMFVIYAWDQYNKTQQAIKATEEKRMSARNEMLVKEKEAFDSRLSEIDNLKDLLEEYKGLNEQGEKTTQTYSRMSEIQTKLTGVFAKYNLLKIKEGVETKNGIGLISQSIDLNKNYASVLDTVIEKTDELRKIEVERMKNTIKDKQTMMAMDIGQKAKDDVTGVIEALKYAKEGGIVDLAAQFEGLLSSSVTWKGIGNMLGGALRGKFTTANEIVLGVDQMEAGRQLMGAWDSTKKKLAEVRKEQEAYAKTLEPTINAHKKLSSTQQENIDKLKAQENALINIQAALLKAGYASEDFNSQIDALNKTLDEMEKKFGKGVGAEAYLKFLDMLRTGVMRSQVVGNLGDKLIEALGKFQRLRQEQKVLETRYGTQVPGANTEAKRLITEWSKNEVGKILLEGTDGLRKFGTEADMMMKKLKGSPEEVAKLEVEMRKISEMDKFKTIEDTLSSALTVLRAKLESLNQPIMGTNIQFVEEQIAGIEQYIKGIQKTQASVAAIKAKVSSAIDLESERAIVKTQIQEAETLRQINKETNTAVSQSWDRYYALSKTAEQQNIENVYAEYRNELFDLEDRRIKALDNKRLAELDHAVTLAIAYENQADELKKMEPILEKIFQYNLMIANIQRELKMSEQVKTSDVAKKYSKGTMSGAMLDIGGGGTGIFKDIAGFSTAIDIANEKWYALSGTVDMFSDKWWEFSIEYQNSMLAANENIMASFENLFGNIANFAENTFDIFGLKAYEANQKIEQELRVDQLLLDDQFRNREITVQEYEATRIMLNKKASIETRKNAALQAAEEKIAMGNVLKSLALEFGVRALAATALGFLGFPNGFKAAAAYASAAVLAGGVGISLMKSGIADKAQIEAQARLESTLAEREAQRASGSSTAADAGGKSIGGTISAQELHIYISPTTTINADTVIMSNIGIEEASQIISDATVERIQEAIDNRELQLQNAIK